MKVFRFFLTRIFLRKPIFAVGTLLLVFMANYIAFSTARAVFSTEEGHEQMEHVIAAGTFIANLDPSETPDADNISGNSMRRVYHYLSDHYQFALYTDGYIANIPNRQDVEVSIGYMNQRYNGVNGFHVAEGNGLTYNYSLDKGEAIPVLVGRGIAAEYPLGSQFTMHDPALDRDLTLKVGGVLAENSSHSNFYALDSKQYYNFSVIIPVTQSYIEQASVPFHLNGLMDLVIVDTDRESVAQLSAYIDRTIHVKFNFFNQRQNNDFYNRYFVSSMSFLGTISGVLLILIVSLSIWSSIASVRVMIRDFTINLLMGLSYARMRRFFYIYYGGLSLLALAAVSAMASYSRYSFWQNRDSSFMTYGVAGLLGMDWAAILVAFLFDLILVTLIVEITTWRLKRVPISMGVLQ